MLIVCYLHSSALWCVSYKLTMNNTVIPSLFSLRKWLYNYITTLLLEIIILLLFHEGIAIVFSICNYTVSRKRPYFYFSNNSHKLTNFNDFWCVRSWENLTSAACTLPTSPVYCSHFTLGNRLKSFSTVLFIHTSDYLRYIRRQQTVTPLPTTNEKCYCTTL